MPEYPRHTSNPPDLYFLAAGVLLGVLLGPAALGRVAPAAYAGLFGGGPATQQLLDYQAETGDIVAALEATGVTADAVTERFQLRQPQEKAIQQAREAVMDLNARSKIIVVFLVLAAVMASRTLYGSPLVTTECWQAFHDQITHWLCYLLVGMGLAVLVARPTLAFNAQTLNHWIFVASIPSVVLPVLWFFTRSRRQSRAANTGSNASQTV